MLSRLSFEYSRLTTLLAERLQSNFYLYLAALLTLGVLIDASVFHVGANMKQKAFDFVVRHRVIKAAPDPDIVIIDINEASLAALAPDIGRWPWPRQVFGELLEKLAAQKPKAVVFDVLFSDPDLQNPDSDAYFNEMIAGSDITFFPYLRLPEEDDALSQVRPQMIPGVTKLDEKSTSQATVAVVLPHFGAALKEGRLGTHNIEPDSDGIVREYRLWQDSHGWRLPSLPWQVARFAAPDRVADAPQNLLINWRGGPFTYKIVTFSDVYRDLSARTPKRPANEFAGKIVIIGSTAPSLFDVKATPMAKLHPGVEILATTIDNLKHGDDLKFWRGQAPYILLSLLAIWLTALAFYRGVEQERFDKLFTRSQLLLLAISYVGLNLSDFYIDLTAPVTWAVACFAIAKIYALANDRVWVRQLRHTPATGTAQTLTLIALEGEIPLGETVMRKIRRDLETDAAVHASIDHIKGGQTGLWGLFDEMLVLSWNADRALLAEPETAHVLKKLPELVRRAGVPKPVAIRHATLSAVLADDKPAGNQWRSLFAEAVLQIEREGKSA